MTTQYKTAASALRIIIREHADETGGAKLKMRTLCELTGKTERTLQRELARLRATGSLTYGYDPETGERILYLT